MGLIIDQFGLVIFIKFYAIQNFILASEVKVDLRG